jgi:hypothetical protein
MTELNLEGLKQALCVLNLIVYMLFYDMLHFSRFVTRLVDLPTGHWTLPYWHTERTGSAVNLSAW